MKLHELINSMPCDHRSQSYAKPMPLLTDKADHAIIGKALSNPRLPKGKLQVRKMRLKEFLDQLYNS